MIVYQEPPRLELVEFSYDLSRKTPLTNAAYHLLKAVVYYRLSKVLMYPRPVKEGKQSIEGRSLGAERLRHDSHTTTTYCVLSR